MTQIREKDVNSAMIQQAADELDIGVPIRSWAVVDGKLELSLAYGGVARWPEDAAPAVLGPGDTPWRFEMAYADEEPPEIPGGSLDRFKKQELRNVAGKWGFQSNSDYVNKAELVEALTWLREDQT